ncbi:hypothetical protein PAEPH01_1315 [Pancytospora epiphaga]|nr:hypothetical protein PAEPH01_1315 [Pancytospora epiphaga]
MTSALAKTKYYFNEYVGSVRWIKIMLMPVAVILIIANYLEIQCTNYSAQITSKDSNKADAYRLLKLYALFFVTGYTLKYIVNIFNAYFIATSIRSGFRNFFHEYLLIKYRDFQNIGVGEAQYNIMRRAAALSEFLTTLTMSFISNAFFFLLVLQAINSTMPANIKLSLFLCLALFLLLSGVIQYYRAGIRRKVNLGLQKNSRKMYDILFNYERIVAYDNLEVECGKYWDSMDRQTYYGIIYWVSYEIVSFCNMLFFILLNVYLIGQFNMIPSMQVGNLKEFMMIVTKLREKLTDISRNMDEICTHFTNLDQSAIEGCEKDENEEGLTISKFEGSIVFQNLSFGYGDKAIFRDVNYTVKSGDKIAIAGVNGAGKSTFVKILLGLYDDYQGSILIDGIEYRNLTKHSIRGLVSYVPQHAYLFDGTVLENLTLRKEEMAYSKVIEHCKLHRMHGAFKSIGYDSQVGERGRNLSGGQRQKISFMRAILKNSPIFILDEATSNMDTRSERKLVKSVVERMASRTVFMIIHNINLLHRFDRVMFFADNTLEEEGSFDELYKANGRFTAFYNHTVQQQK